MKHHKVKDLWRLMPDRPPLPEESPSTGKNRKIKVPSKKHLRDKLRQEIKELTKFARWVIFEHNPWMSPLSGLKRVERTADRADNLFDKLGVKR